jgi:hypothetical protein
MCLTSIDNEARKKNYTIKIGECKTVKTVCIIRTAIVLFSKKLYSFYRTKAFSLALSFQQYSIKKRSICNKFVF